MTGVLLPADGRWSVRAADGGDLDVLARATLENVNWNGPRFTIDDVRDSPEFRHYYDPWPGPEDFGLIAESDATGVIAAVWLKHFTTDNPGYGFISEDIPELSIWVDAAYRGHGIGGALLAATINEARTRGLPAISLSVEDGNPAARLYERHGFAPAGSVAGCLLRQL